MDETLAYISESIYSMPSCSTQEFSFEKDESHFILNTNADILDLSSKLFIFVGKELRSAIELAFEYVRRKPSSAPNLVRHINEQFMYRHNDTDFSHYRQSELLCYVIEQVEKGDALCQQIMWYIAKLFLAFSTNYSGPAIERNSYSLYQYPVPALKSILKIRKESGLQLKTTIHLTDLLGYLRTTHYLHGEEIISYPNTTFLISLK